MLQWRLISKLQFNQVKTKLQSRHELVRVLRRRGLSEALHGEEQEQEEEEQEGLRGENSCWKPSKCIIISITSIITITTVLSNIMLKGDMNEEEDLCAVPPHIMRIMQVAKTTNIGLILLYWVLLLVLATTLI